MPLPPALLARLKNRGIVSQNVKDDSSETRKRPSGIHQALPGEEVEEVFAEDYDNDEPSEPALDTSKLSKPKVQKTYDEEPVVPSLVWKVADCPNAWNPYHECVDWCKKRWGCKPFKPDALMLKRRSRMLRRYALPQDWYEIADTETNRYFYWNPVTDEISWLSPSHPRAQITLSAEKIKEVAKAAEKPKRAADFPVNSDDERQEEENAQAKLAKLREKRSSKKAKFSRNSEKDELDPMDPASYGECGRGSWSAGLDLRGSAKTGVDSSASGPLFQQRPYPSPGAILRANKALEDS